MATVTNLKSEPPRTAPDRPTVAIVATGAARGAEDKTMAKRQYRIDWPFHGSSMTTYHRTISGAARASLKRHGECICSPKFRLADGSRATDIEIESYDDARIRAQAGAL
jgi:hypothetical protein